jgi:hypothetical protein
VAAEHGGTSADGGRAGEADPSGEVARPGRKTRFVSMTGMAHLPGRNIGAGFGRAGWSGEPSEYAAD